MVAIELAEQETVETACPECASEPTDESVVMHKLSRLGYAHDDQMFECADCSHQWAHGVPIGSSDAFAEELECRNPLCERVYSRVHRALLVQLDGEQRIGFHTKCPACFFFDSFVRQPDPAGRVLVGYPDITGETADAEAYGYIDEEV